MTEQDLSNVFEEATMQALMYGVGICSTCIVVVGA